MNEMPELVNGNAKIFTDATKMRNYKLQKGLDILSNWYSKWLLKFKESKCNINMHIGENPRHDYKVGYTTLDKVSQDRALADYLTDLKQCLQCVEAAKKAASAFGIILRTFSYSDTSIFNRQAQAI